MDDLLEAMKRIKAFLISSEGRFVKYLNEYFSSTSIDLIIASSTLSLPDQVKKTNPDVIVVDHDIDSPKMRSFYRDIESNFTDIPVIALAVDNSTSFLSTILNIPADDFMVKPIETKILHYRILSQVEKSAKETIYKNGTIELNDLNKVVKINGKKVNFTPREYRLLLYLLRNKGAVKSRSNILNHVWGRNSEVLDRNVDVYIGYLRKKIGNNRLIKTIPTFGYMMKDCDLG